MLKVNTILIELNVGLNLFSVVAVAAFVAALGVNKTLTALSIGGYEQNLNEFVVELMGINGTLTRLALISVEGKKFNDRNKLMHARAGDALVTFVLCWKWCGSALSWLNKGSCGVDCKDGVGHTR